MTSDDAMMDRLRRIAAEVDGVPELVDETARAALSTRHLDAELAELLQDSDLAGATTVRAAQPGPRLLSYEAGDISIELQLEDVHGALVLRGIAVGAVDAAEIETTAEVRAVPVDEHGWFRAEGVTAGPLRIRLRTADGIAVTTGWIRA